MFIFAGWIRRAHEYWKLNETLQSEDYNEQVSFAQAVTQGLGKNQGLFFPHDLPEFSLTEIDEMLKLDFVTRSAKHPLGVYW